MDAAQNVTDLDPRKQALIDFVATGGMVIDDLQDRPTKLTAEDLANKLGVDRRTLYRWRDSMPNFWDLVTERRNEIYNRSRMTKVYNAVFNKAIKGDIAAANLLMKQGGILKADKQEVQQVITVDSLDWARTG